MAHSMLYRFARRLSMPREKRHRLYNRYLWWCAGRVGKYGVSIGRDKHRENQLNIRRFNRGGG